MGMCTESCKIKLEVPGLPGLETSRSGTFKFLATINDFSFLTVNCLVYGS